VVVELEFHPGQPSNGHRPS